MTHFKWSKLSSRCTEPEAGAGFVAGDLPIGIGFRNRLSFFISISFSVYNTCLSLVMYYLVEDGVMHLVLGNDKLKCF